VPKNERCLPYAIDRFNYWTYGCVRPMPSQLLQPFLQRLADFSDESWEGPAGNQAAQRYVERTFLLLLNATPEEWLVSILPSFKTPLSEIQDRHFYALEFYAENEKLWRSNTTAQRILKALSPQKRSAIDSLSKKKWSERRGSSWRTDAWNHLLRTIAHDIDIFQRFCEAPPESGSLHGTDQRIYLSYNRQAIHLLGGGTFIAKQRRHHYVDLLDESGKPASLVGPNGRLHPANSIFDVNWTELSTRKERRNAKKKTIHWFHHALRNLRLYRHRHDPVPWSLDCEKECRLTKDKTTAS
jgi:hypothetical protein